MSKTISKEKLNTLYWEKELSQTEIANIFHVAKITIQYWMYKYKIPRRPKGFRTKRMLNEISLKSKGRHNSIKTEFKPTIDLSKKQLEKLYLEKKLSMRQIGRSYGVTRKAIKRHLKKNNIPIRATRDEYDQLRIKNLKEYMGNPTNKQAYSERMKKMVANPNNRKKGLKALNKKPTKLEEKLIKIINKNKLPYRYVGNGEFILGGKCPDFLNCNGKKQVIETFGRVFHDPAKTFKKSIPYHQTEKGTMEHYEKYGFDCLVIWGEELDNEQNILDKLERFR